MRSAALVTKSANDAAVVIAEALGGDEDEFAELMTRKAHALGMTRTVYRNASGLPNDEQVTTARDQATLGRAIQERFPRYYRYFSMPSFTYHGQSMRNHNHLLGQVQGVDGIKTGYTQASGFNLVTSVRRDNRHIVSVVLGGASAGARDARMRTLIEQYIVAAATQPSTTAVAQATRDPQAVELRTAEARAAESAPKFRAEARPAKPAPQAPQATYSVASYGKPVTWPAPTAAPAPVVSGQPVAPVLADAAPTAAVPAAKPASTDPIQPIQVRTVKVKLPQIAALLSATRHFARAGRGCRSAARTVRRPPLRAVPPQAAAAPLPAPPSAPAAKPAAVPQKAAAALGTLPFREITPASAEPKREAPRELVREAFARNDAKPTAASGSAPKRSAPSHVEPGHEPSHASPGGSFRLDHPGRRAR